jgi:anaerobic selenocysteine-containing dehydrogenase/Fe-S-cluster-containing dehydrogenase component
MADDTTREGMDRRRFLTVLGVTGGGAAVMSGCSTDRIEKLVPYLVQSEDQVPGIPTWYASTCTECAAGCGLHVKTREGRAIKLEGNPDHPVNGGKLCSHGQSALQDLYHPARLKGPMKRQGKDFINLSWDEAIALLAQQLGQAKGRLAVLSGAGRGTLSDLLDGWAKAQNGSVVRYRAFDSEAIRAGNQLVFGVSEVPAYDFAAAKYVLSFGADFLENWISPVEHQRGFAAAHGFGDSGMARHVMLAPRMSLTGMNADEWLAIRPGTEAVVALAMAGVILSERSAAPNDANALRTLLAPYTPDKAHQESGITAEAIIRVAREFASGKPSLAVAGGVAAQHRGAIEVCAAVNILNYVAGNVGQTVRFGADLDAGDGYGVLLGLAQSMERGEVGVVVVHETNPLFTVPKAANFGAAFAKVPFKVSTARTLDETAAQCDLLLPGHHPLERWDDARPRRGVMGLMQPVMEPVFGTMATGDVILKVAQKAGLAQFTAPTFEAHLKTQWAAVAKTQGAADAEAFWRSALQKGGLFQPAPVTPVRLAPTASSAGYTAPALDGPEGGDSYVLLASPSLMGDGRFANRPWLLELSDPVTKITWHPWLELHPEVAARLDVQDGEIVRVTSPHGEVELPAYRYAGIHPQTVSVPLGWGHTELSEFATGRGANALDLIDAKDGKGFLPYLSTRVSLTKTSRWKPLAKTEGNPRQLGRGIADAMTLEQARQGLTPALAEKAEGHAEHEVNPENEVEGIQGFRASQLEKRKRGGYAGDQPMWGMVVDLARCTGCSACVTACYAENNIPWVGEDQVLRGREMTWIRIERYWEGGEGGEPLEARFVPMMCQHCDAAPCEPVCPVYAAYHTVDGLNGQVYNRCVGTRYCSNNCPYKVRYFNWLAYNQKAFPEPLNLQLNPDVTVRARGVMEKCTFCIQRIRGAQNRARLEDRPLADGEFTTACAQACPSDAIVFGNLKDGGSRVSQLAQNHRGYHVFEETNVRPAVTYLAKVLHRAEA